MKKVRSFSGIDWYEFEKNRIKSIESEIVSQGKDYLLKIDEDEYIQFVVANYKLNLLEVDFDKEGISENGKSTLRIRDTFSGQYHGAEHYNIKISYPYLGDAILFEVTPNSRTLTDYEITIEEHTVSFIVLQREQDPEIFKQNKDRALNSAFANLKSINQCAEEWNLRVHQIVTDAFNKRKTHLKSEGSFFEAISLQTRKESEGLFSVPAVKKKA